MFTYLMAVAVSVVALGAYFWGVWHYICEPLKGMGNMKRMFIVIAAIALSPIVAAALVFYHLAFGWHVA